MIRFANLYAGFPPFAFSRAWLLERVYGYATIAIVLVSMVASLNSAAEAQGIPVFSTQTPLAGEVGSKFVVFLPVFNTGTADATGVQVTSVTLGHSVPVSPTLPQNLQTLAAGDHVSLDLQFDSTNLVLGARYLLTVRGTYQIGTQTLGFAVNRFITVTAPSDFALTQLQHWIALDALKDFVNSLPGVDTAADNQATLDFLRGRPEFTDSDIDVPSSSVWATFDDGEQIIVANDRKFVSPASTGSQVPSLSQLSVTSLFSANPAPSSFSGAATSTAQDPLFLGTEIPHSSAVSLRNTLSSLAFNDADLVSDLAMMLSDPNNNYQVTQPDSRVDGSLPNAGGDGVFYFTSHGGFTKRKGMPGVFDYAIYTATKADPYMDLVLPTSDVFGTATSDRTLIKMLATVSKDLVTQKPIDELHYGIKASYVRKHFQPFSDGSLVYIDACSSDDPRLTAGEDAQDMKRAFFDKNASVYAGWTNTVLDPVSTQSARLVFDRFLGANKFFLETLPTSSGAVFKQRSFDWQSVLEDLPKHGLGSDADLDAGTLAQLTFTQNPNLSSNIFSQLSPSIGPMFSLETGPGAQGQPVLNIFGSFGVDPGTDGFVTVGGIQTNVLQWLPDEVLVNLPTGGQGAAGDVVVAVRQHKSNPARMTEWQATFNFDMPGSLPGLDQSATFNPMFRADIRQFRPVIHDPPQEPAAGLMEAMLPGSINASFKCTGVTDPVPFELGGGTTTYTWTGNGSAPAYDESSAGIIPPPDLFYAFNGQSLQSHTTVKAGLVLHQKNPPCNLHTHNVFFGPPRAEIDTDLAIDFSFGNGSFSLTLDDQANIQADKATFPGLTCIGPPPNFCTGTLRWNNIQPVSGTAPDPDSPR